MEREKETPAADVYHDEPVSENAEFEENELDCQETKSRLETLKNARRVWEQNRLDEVDNLIEKVTSNCKELEETFRNSFEQFLKLLEIREMNFMSEVQSVHESKVSALTQYKASLADSNNDQKISELESLLEQEDCDNFTTKINSKLADLQQEFGHMVSCPPPLPPLPGGTSCGFAPEFNSLHLATNSLVNKHYKELDIGDKVSVSVIGGVDRQGFFWVRVLPGENGLQDTLLQNISNGLQVQFGSTFTPVSSPRPGMCCAARYYQDQSWYRGRIVTRPKHGKVSVFFIDYGNTEECQVSSLAPLDDKFMVFPQQMLRCCFTPDKITITREAKWKFTDLTHSQSLSAVLLTHIPGPPEDGEQYYNIVKLLDESSSQPIDIGAIVTMLASEAGQSKGAIKCRDVRYKDLPLPPNARQTITGGNPPVSGGEHGVTGGSAEPSVTGVSGDAGVTTEPSVTGVSGDAGVTTEPSVTGDSGEGGEHGQPSVTGDSGEGGEHGQPNVTGDSGEGGEHGQPSVTGDSGEGGEHGQPSVTGDSGEGGEQREPNVTSDSGEGGEQREPNVTSDSGEGGEQREPSVTGDSGEGGEQREPNVTGDSGEGGEQREPNVTGDSGEGGEHGQPSVTSDSGEGGEHGQPSVTSDSGEGGEQREPNVTGDSGEGGEHGQPSVTSDSGEGGEHREPSVTGEGSVEVPCEDQTPADVGQEISVQSQVSDPRDGHSTTPDTLLIKGPPFKDVPTHDEKVYNEPITRDKSTSDNTLNKGTIGEPQTEETVPCESGVVAAVETDHEERLKVDQVAEKESSKVDQVVGEVSSKVDQVVVKESSKIEPTDAEQGQKVIQSSEVTKPKEPSPKPHAIVKPLHIDNEKSDSNRPIPVQNGDLEPNSDKDSFPFQEVVPCSDVKQSPLCLMNPAVQPGALLDLYVSTDLTTEGTFWAHLETSDSHNNMFDQLQAKTSEIKETYTPVFFGSGDICAALFSEDECWYRAKIEEFKNQKFTVRYLDFGNYEMRPLPLLAPLKPEFTVLPGLALKCSLSCDDHVTFTQPEIAKFDKIIPEGKLKAKVLEVKGDTVHVQLLLSLGGGGTLDLNEEIYSADLTRQIESMEFTLGKKHTKNKTAELNLSDADTAVTSWADQMDEIASPSGLGDGFLTLAGFDSDRTLSPSPTPHTHKHTPPHSHKQTSSHPHKTTHPQKSSEPKKQIQILKRPESSNVRASSPLVAHNRDSRERSGSPFSKLDKQTGLMSFKQENQDAKASLMSFKRENQDEKASLTSFKQEEKASLTSFRQEEETSLTNIKQEDSEKRKHPSSSKPVERSSPNDGPSTTPSTRGAPRNRTAPKLDMTAVRSRILPNISGSGKNHRKDQAPGRGEIDYGERLASGIGTVGEDGGSEQTTPTQSKSDVAATHIQSKSDVVATPTHSKSDAVATPTQSKFSSRSTPPPSKLSQGTQDIVCLFVKNVPQGKEITFYRNIFTQYGHVHHVQTDAVRRTVCYVYMSPEGAQKAITTLYGKTIDKNSKPLVIETTNPNRHTAHNWPRKR